MYGSSKRKMPLRFGCFTCLEVTDLGQHLKVVNRFKIRRNFRNNVEPYFRANKIN
jgi:hypothetical protein